MRPGAWKGPYFSVTAPLPWGLSLSLKSGVLAECPEPTSSKDAFALAVLVGILCRDLSLAGGIGEGEHQGLVHVLTHLLNHILRSSKKSQNFNCTCAELRRAAHVLTLEMYQGRAQQGAGAVS